jgi:hypothetical protein
MGALTRLIVKSFPEEQSPQLIFFREGQEVDLIIAPGESPPADKKHGVMIMDP